VAGIKERPVFGNRKQDQCSENHEVALSMLYAVSMLLLHSLGVDRHFMALDWKL